MLGQLFPVLFAFLAFGQVQLGDELLRALQRDTFTVFVKVFDDVLLVSRVFSHGVGLDRGQVEKVLVCPMEIGGLSSNVDQFSMSPAVAILAGD